MALTGLFNKKDDNENTTTATEESPKYYSSMDKFRASLGGTASSNTSNNTSGNNKSSNYKSSSYSSNQSAYDRFLYRINNPVQQTEEKTERGVMDRLFGVLGYSGIVEGLYNLADDDPDSTFLSGLGEGFKYMNPFNDDVSGRHSFSDVLEEAGWEDKEDGKLNVGRGVVGFLGDVLLDPISYINPYSSILKVVKGSGIGVDVAKGLSDVNKAGDIVKEIKAVTGGVKNVNVSHIKALDYQTAEKIVTDSITTDKTGRATLWTQQDIEKRATDLMNNFNKKIMKLSSGGEDLTVGIGNLFPSKVKVGGKQLDSFKKTLASSDALRSLGDRTIAPYFNDLAKKLRTSRWGKRFSKNAELEDLAKTDFEEAVKEYYFRELKTGIFRIGLDEQAFKNANIFRDFYESLNEADKKDFLEAIENGDFFGAKKTKALIKELKNKYGIEYNEADAEVWTKKVNDQIWDFLDNFNKRSGKTKIKNRREKLESQGYYDLPPIKGEYATEDEFKTAKEAWKKRNPNKKYEDEIYDYKDDKLFRLSDYQKRGFREFGEAAGKFNKKYDFLNTEKSRERRKAIDTLGTIKLKEYKKFPIGLADPILMFDDLDNAYAGPFGVYIGSQYLKRDNDPLELALAKVNDYRRAGALPSHVGQSSSYANFETVGLHEAGHMLGSEIELVNPSEWQKIKQMYDKWLLQLKILGIDEDYAVSLRAMDNTHDFFTEMLSNIVLHNPQDKMSQEFRNIVESFLGKKLEQWEPLKFLQDDEHLKNYEKEYRQYTKDTLGKEYDWWDNIEDIDKQYMDSLGITDQYLLVNKINQFYHQVKNIEKFGDEGANVAQLWIEEMKKVAEREVAAGFLTKEQAASRFGKYISHFSKEQMAKFKNKEGFILSEEDMEVLEDMIHLPLNGKFDPDVLGTLERFDYERELNTTIPKANAIAQARIGREIFETSLADIYLARVLGSNKLLYGDETQRFLKKNFLTPLYSGDIDSIPFTHEPVVLYKDVKPGLLNYARSIVKPNEDAYTKSEELLNEFIKLGDTHFGTTFSPNNVLQKLNKEQVEFLQKCRVSVSHASKGVINDANSVTRVQKAQMTSSMMRAYDKFMHIWKLQNTIVIPGFHTQNLVSNAFQSFLAIGSDAFNPAKLKKAYKIYTNPDPKQTIKIGDKVWTFQELNYAAKKTGVVDEMFHTFEFSDDSPGGLIKALPKSLDPTDTEDFLPYKWATKIGGSIEGVQRLNLFISALKQTDNDIAKASEIVDKFLFDYSDVTEFEQDIVKRIIPFYTFMKKNFPMELEQMIEQPTTYTMLQKAYNNFEKSGNNEYYGENDRSEWRQEHIQLPFDTEDGDTYGIADQLPYNQIERIVDPQKVLGQTSPAIKTPIEALLGKYVYTGSDIGSAGEYLANQTFWSKLPVVASNYDDPVQKRNYIIGQLTGFPIGKINRD